MVDDAKMRSGCVLPYPTFPHRTLLYALVVILITRLHSVFLVLWLQLCLLLPSYLILCLGPLLHLP